MGSRAYFISMQFFVGALFGFNQKFVKQAPRGGLKHRAFSAMCRKNPAHPLMDLNKKALSWSVRDSWPKVPLKSKKILEMEQVLRLCGMNPLMRKYPFQTDRGWHHLGFWAMLFPSQNR